MSIHPTAIIDRKAEIDSSVEIGPYCVIDANVRVEKNCRLYHGVYLTGWTEIAEGCVIHPGAIVGHAPQDIDYSGDRSYCRIGKNTVLREYVTIHRGTKPESQTVVGEECFILTGTHIGHNCVIGNHVTMVNDVLLGGYVEIQDHANLGGRAGIHQFVRIGELSMIAGTSRIVQDVIPFSITDCSGKIVGMNRIGLKRSEIPKNQIEDIREAYRVIMGKNHSFQDTIDQITKIVSTPAGHRLLVFLQADSKRGFSGRSSSKSRNNSTLGIENSE